jgi:peroxiredoxin Q/BCP
VTTTPTTAIRTTDSSRPRRRRTLVGEAAPDFALPDPVTGKTVRLSEYAAGRDVLLIFLRGTWCPYCVEQLKVLTERHEQLTGCGIAVLAVVCQAQTTVRAFLKFRPVPFPVLCDGSRATAKAYGSHYWLTHEGFNLSNPALFVLDRKGTVTFQHVGRSMSDLPVGYLLDKFCALLEGDGGDGAATATA